MELLAQIRSKENRKKKIGVVCGALALLVAFIVLWAIYGKELYAFVADENRFKAWILSFGRWSDVIFVTVRSVQTVVKIIPAEPLEIGAGYIFGAWYGCFLCWLGSMLGTVAIIILTKLLGTKVIEIFVPKSKAQSFSFLKNKSRVGMSLFIIYLIPSTPKDLISYFVEFLPIKVWTFLAITGVARIPSIITSTICGAALGEKNFWLAAAVFGGTAVAGLIGIMLYRKFTAKQNPASEEGAEDTPQDKSEESQD